MSTLLSNRYEVLEKLGEGAMGAVFHAVDRLTDEAVALKRVTVPTRELEFASLATIGADTTGLRHALAVEFKTLASLRHPHIISVLDYGFEVTATEHKPYFTMELLEESTNILIASFEQPLQRQVQLIIEVLLSLAYLHRRDILHRDLKPANILVDADGKVKVLDFGLSVTQDHVKGTAGTIAYLAPEVLRGTPANHIADLYAVGIIAYQMITRDFPFDRTSPTQLISDILYKEIDFSIIDSPELQSVFEKWLNKNPAERFATSEDIIRALSKAIGQAPPTETVAIRESFLQSAEFVGRETERETLLTALQAAIKGEGRAILIGGESGVGKSRLLEEIRIQALVDGVLVLHGQGVEGGGLPFQIWRGILPRLILNVPPTDEEAGVLRELVPDIERLLGRQIPTISKLNAEDQQQRLVTTIKELILRYNQPIVLLLEDLHWTTASLLPLIALIQSETFQQDSMLIVATYRDDERPDLATELVKMQHIGLKRMSDQEIVQLSRSMLGEKGNHPNLLQLLHKETEGNVFFLIEVVRALAEEAGQLEDIGVITLPEKVFAGGIETIIRRRLDQVAPSYQSALKLAAVVGRHIDLSLMQRLVGESASEWLLACADAAVLDVHDEGWRFSHDKLRETLMDTLEEDERRSLHRQVAEAIEVEYPDNPDYAVILMEHWFAVGDVERTMPYAKQVTEHHMMLSTWDEGMQLADRMLRLLAENPSENSEEYRMKFLYTRAEVARQKAQYDEAREFLAQVAVLAEKLDDNDVLAEVYTSHGDIAARLSDHQQAFEYIERGLDIHRKAGNTHGIAESINELGVVAWRQGQFQQAGEYFEEALALFKPLGDPERIAALMGNVAAVKTLQGHLDEAEALTQQALKINIDEGIIWGQGHSHDTLGNLALFRGDYERALDHLRQATRLMEACGDLASIVETYGTTSRAATMHGDLELAYDYAKKSIDLSKKLDDQWGRANALYGLGLAYVAEGKLDDAKKVLQESLQIRRDTGQEALAEVLADLTQVEYQLGNAPIAYQHIVEATQAAQREGMPRIMISVLIGAIQLALGDQNLDLARQWINLVMHHPNSGTDQTQILNKIILSFDIKSETLASSIQPDTLNQALAQIGEHFSLQHQNT